MPDVMFRGIAIPYAESAWLSGGWECVAPGAFAGMLERGGPISFRLNSHDGPQIGTTQNGKSGLFDAPVGLCFWLLVDGDDHRRHSGLFDLARGDNSTNTGCSVGGLRIDAQSRDVWRGAVRVTVTAAAIDHIAIGTIDRAVYATGACLWRAASAEQLPWNLRLRAEEWAAGAAAWNRQVTQRAAQPPAPVGRSPGLSSFNSTELLAMRRLGFTGRPIGIAPRALRAMLRAAS